MASAKKVTPGQGSPLQKVFESGVKEALNVFRGKKTPADAASSVLNTAKRAERQGNASKKAKA